MKLKTKNILKFFTVGALTAVPLLTLTSCGQSSQFFLANFQSYMSPDLESSLQSEFQNLNFRSYSSNEDLERGFVRNYDVAVPSTYLVAKLARENKLVELDWSRFNLVIPGTNQPITNATQALTLFTPAIQQALTQVYDLDDADNLPGGETDNLLRFSVPYFFQDFVLGYKGAQKEEISGSVNWQQILDYFSGKIGSGRDFNRIGMIEDFRTIFSIPRLIQTSDNENVTVNPTSETVSRADFQSAYQEFSNRFETNNFLLNSDSGLILNNFANPRGSDVGIMYNGDLLYAIQGGDDGIELDPTQIQFIRPQNTLLALDAMVINKETNNVDMAYDLIKKISLEGSDAADISLMDDNGTPNDESDDFFKFGPMRNFDYIAYTSPLQNVSNYVLSEDPDNGYFGAGALADLSRRIYNIGTPSNLKNLLEQDVSDLQKSNMYQAFVRERMNF